MSTVGYGDYGPKTVLGRPFVFVIILGGIVSSPNAFLVA